MASKVYVITWKEFEDGCMSVETPTKAAAFAKEADADLKKIADGDRDMLDRLNALKKEVKDNAC